MEIPYDHTVQSITDSLHGLSRVTWKKLKSEEEELPQEKHHTGCIGPESRRPCHSRVQPLGSR